MEAAAIQGPQPGEVCFALQLERFESAQESDGDEALAVLADAVPGYKDLVTQSFAEVSAELRSAADEILRELST